MTKKIIPLPTGHLSISAVEREIGLSKDALRVWERRYGFPNPQRDAFGERSYSPEQIEKLRLIKRLMDRGHRPGKIVALAMPSLHDLAAQSTPATSSASAHPHAGVVQALMDTIKRHQVEELREQLSTTLLHMGLADFVVDVIAPLTTAVGDAWARGHFAVHQEHMFTETAQVVLRNAINTIPVVARAPRVLLTTIPQEPHGLGLLMAEVMLSIEGCSCVSLGVQTPVLDIALAAQAQRADIVALSFSALTNPNFAVASLRDLRARLSTGIDVWAGGSCPVLHGKRAPEGVVVMRGLAGIHANVAHWRSQR
jgi:MerR family transcriptional regulator, light-induced transcriptional regulator